jgi:hypothetical protein
LFFAPATTGYIGEIYTIAYLRTLANIASDMKRLLFLLFSIGFSHCSWGQVTEFLRVLTTEAQTIKFDTTYFDNGQIETITRQSWFVPTSNQCYKVREIKTVYQYDKCGHWRNTTTIFEDNDPMRYGVYGPRRWREDKLVIGATCEVSWTKPLIL